MSKEVIRIGDTVKIIDPRRVIKVGYRYDTDYYFDLIMSDTRSDFPALESLVKSLQLDHKAHQDIARAIARCWANTSKTGGVEREIFFSETSRLAEGEERVVGNKCVRYTGTYQPGFNYRGVRGMYEPEYEPPHLDPIKAHVLLNVSWGNLHCFEPCFELETWVCSDQVQLVRRAPQDSDHRGDSL